jgi:hypothetical protein
MTNTTRDFLKMCQIALASAARASLAHFSKITRSVNHFIIYMTKLLQSDWLRGVQLFH